MKKSAAAFIAIAGLFAGSSVGSTAPSDLNIFVNLSKKIVPSVVNISSYVTLKGQQNAGGPDDFFRRFFDEFLKQHSGGGSGGGDDEEEPQPFHPNPKITPKGPKAVSLGTGFIIDSGLVLTNNHVVQEADEIKIYFTEEADEKPSDGEVVGRDTELDVALIRVKSKREMTPVVLGDSDATEVGEYVIAVGNPFGQGHSVTHGIISAKGRLAPDFPLANYLQTDAPINPGNSGGPLVNLKGEVIGINNAIHQGAQGIGFAIPISLVKKVLPQLRTSGTVSRGYIGVIVNELTPELAAKLGVPKDLKAPFVTQVYPGEPADKAGVKTYDVILEVNGKKITNSLDLIQGVTAVSVGETVPIKINRAGSEKTLQIKISKRPGNQEIEKKEKEDSSKKKKKAKEPSVDIGAGVGDLDAATAQELGMAEKSKGVVIESVAYDGPSDHAGLMRGDVILEVDRKTIKDADAFYGIVKDKKSYLLRVRRLDPQGKEAFLVIVLDLKDA